MTYKKYLFLFYFDNLEVLVVILILADSHPAPTPMAVFSSSWKQSKVFKRKWAWLPRSFSTRALLPCCFLSR